MHVHRRGHAVPARPDPPSGPRRPSTSALPRSSPAAAPTCRRPWCGRTRAPRLLRHAHLRIHGIPDAVDNRTRTIPPPRPRTPTDARSATRHTASSTRLMPTVAVGEIGELLVKGPEALVGYLRPEDEIGAFTADGWFRTGDLASADADGYLTIRGRKQGHRAARRREHQRFRGRRAALRPPRWSTRSPSWRCPTRCMVERACAFVVPSPGMRPDAGRPERVSRPRATSPNRSTRSGWNYCRPCPKPSPARCRSTCYVNRFAT